jgi:hypothetical protein
LFDAAFLEAIEFFARLAVEVLSVDHEEAFLDAGFAFSSVEALKLVSVLPLPVVCQT